MIYPIMKAVITIALKPVATIELSLAKPILANTVTKAANMALNKARIDHIMFKHLSLYG